MDSKLSLIEKLIIEGEEFSFTNFSITKYTKFGVYGGKDTPQWATFKNRVKNIILSSCEDDSSPVLLVNEAMSARTEGNSPTDFEFVKNNLLTALNQLKNALENDIYGELNERKSTSNSPVLSNKVFVVHGHDDKLKLDVENFIHQIGLEPIVLHRQANEGQTIIEKFERNSDVGFAFIVLTPDEISYTLDQENKVDVERKKEYRARPNVIFEFGYFVGKLGRNRVCCLLKGNTVVPTDVSGVVYHKIDNSIEEKGFAIIKELKAAGYKINM